MYEITKLQISSVAKVSGIASGLLGLIPAIFSLFMYLLTSSLFRPGYYSSLYDYRSNSQVLSLLFILVIPLLAALVGYIYGAIMALIYNLVVPFVGGIKMKIEMVNEGESQNITNMYK